MTIPSILINCSTLSTSSTTEVFHNDLMNIPAGTNCVKYSAIREYKHRKLVSVQEGLYSLNQTLFLLN